MELREQEVTMVMQEKGDQTVGQVQMAPRDQWVQEVKLESVATMDKMANQVNAVLMVLLAIQVQLVQLDHLELLDFLDQLVQRVIKGHRVPLVDLESQGQSV